MRIVIRISRWAVRSRRLGSVAVPLVVISVLLHRFELITSDVFLVVAITAGLVAALAVLTGLIALVRLWQTGDQGWSRALTGLLFGGLCLLPYAWYGALAWRYPQVTDIATTDRSVLPLVFEPGMQAMPPPKLISAEAVATTFPNAQTRTYPLGLVPTFGVVKAMVADRDWDVRLVRDPEADLETAQLNARIMTLPGWREEVVIRVSGGLNASTVDMRSASLNAVHDFGSNGVRIEDFLMALDDEVTRLLRDNPNANRPAEPEPEAVVTTEPE